MALRVLYICAILLVLPGIAEGQTTINLRPSARLADDAQQVRLADVADISGGDPALADTIIVSTISADQRANWLKLDVATVRSALDNLPGDMNWGKVSIHGGTCTVRFTDPKLATKAPTPRKGETGPSVSPQPVDLSGPPTIKSTVAARLAALYGVTEDRIRLAFDAGDEGLLATLLGSRQASVSPGGLASSSRLPVNITLYEGDRVVLTHTLQVSALVYRPVMVAAGTIERNRVITPDQINAIEQWITPGSKPPATSEQIVDSIAQKRIAAGEVIDADDVAAPLACKRGDIVTVHCLSGSVVIKLRARALGSARDGELVQLKAENSDAPFTGRMSGRGLAVLVAAGDDSTNKPGSKKPLRKAASR